MNRERTNSGAWRWEITAACCFGGGIGAALIGSVLTAMTWFLGVPLHPWLRGTGTALLIATIPLLIFSGYCLDWGEKRKRSFKRRAGTGRYPERTIDDRERDQESGRKAGVGEKGSQAPQSELGKTIKLTENRSAETESEASGSCAI